jgi:hypothetical protein
MLPLDVVTKLNECANTNFVTMRDWWFGVVSCATALVAFGLVLEAPELVHDLIPIGRKIISSLRRSSIEFPKHKAPDWVKVVAFVGWILIVVGVVGEEVAGIKVKDLDADIQECSNAKVRAVTKQATDATAELKRLKSPRSLSNESELVSALAPFKGTKYMFFSVFGDEESINLLKQIDGMLRRAEWKQCQPGSSCQPGRPFPPALNILSHGTTLGVSQGVTAGITISVESTESAPSLQALPAEKLPPHVRAALALGSDLSSNLSPQQENGVGKALNVISGTDRFVLISVGKKP